MITVFPADVNLTPDLPHIAGLTYQSLPIERYFSQAAGGALQIAFDWSRRDRAASILADNGLDPGHLEQALAMVLAPGGAATGLLLCDSLASDPVLGLDPSQYGFMFDMDGDAGTGLQPRMGCAVFLSPILLKATALSAADILAFIAFTAVHELGHVFNLWHSPEGATTFMTPHPDPTEIPKGALGHTFDDDQAHYLSLIADPTDGGFVQPGGSNFGDRAPGFPQGLDPGASLEGPAPDFDLQIRATHEVCDTFDPIEVLVAASVPQGARALVAPDEFHPAYSRFELWITDPDGEHRRLRPSHRYCRPGPILRLEPGEAVHREIWLGGPASLPTFRAAGAHGLQARFTGGAGGPILSNRIQVEVLPARIGDPTYDRPRTILRDPRLRRTLQHRRLMSRSAYEALAQLAEVGESSPTGRAIAYALGIALQKSARASRAKERAAGLEARGRAHLDQALAGEPHAGRRAEIERLLDRRGLRRPPRSR